MPVRLSGCTNGLDLEVNLGEGVIEILFRTRCCHMQERPSGFTQIYKIKINQPTSLSMAET